MRRLNIASLLAKIETTYGVDAVPTGAANAILLRGKPILTPMDMTLVNRDILHPFMGNGDALVGSIYSKLSFEVEIASSGTAGTAPALGVLLRAAGLSQNILATAVTGTAQSSAIAGTVRLSAAASAVNDFYTGLPISITAGVGLGQTGVITQYDGVSKLAYVSGQNWSVPDATSTYSINPGVVYRPVSSAFESVTLYFNLDGVLHRLLGARGNAVLDFSSQKIPFIKFDLEGLFQAVTDTVMPATVFTGWDAPLVCTPTNTPYFDFHDTYTTVLENMSFDCGVAVSKLSLINGDSQVMVDARAPKFTVSTLADTMAVKNWYDRCATATPGDFCLTHGTVAGNKVSLSAKSTRLSNPKHGAVGNILTIGMDGLVIPSNGNDEFSICFY